MNSKRSKQRKPLYPVDVGTIGFFVLACVCLIAIAGLLIFGIGVPDDGDFPGLSESLLLLEDENRGIERIEWYGEPINKIRMFGYLPPDFIQSYRYYCTKIGATARIYIPDKYSIDVSLLIATNGDYRRYNCRPSWSQSE